MFALSKGSGLGCGRVSSLCSTACFTQSEQSGVWLLFTKQATLCVSVPIRRICSTYRQAYTAPQIQPKTAHCPIAGKVDGS